MTVTPTVTARVKGSSGVLRAPLRFADASHLRAWRTRGRERRQARRNLRLLAGAVAVRVACSPPRNTPSELGRAALLARRAGLERPREPSERPLVDPQGARRRRRSVDRDARRVGLADEPDVWVDVRAFDEHVRGGRFEEALELVRGEPLEGLDDEWVYEFRDEHRERLSQVLENLASQSETGRASGVVTPAGCARPARRGRLSALSSPG